MCVTAPTIAIGIEIVIGTEIAIGIGIAIGIVRTSKKDTDTVLWFVIPRNRGVSPLELPLSGSDARRLVASKCPGYAVLQPPLTGREMPPPCPRKYCKAKYLQENPLTRGLSRLIIAPL